MNELSEIGPVQLMSVGFDPGARSLGDSFLTPETVAAMEPQLAALAARIRAS